MIGQIEKKPFSTVLSILCMVYSFVGGNRNAQSKQEKDDYDDDYD